MESVHGLDPIYTVEAFAGAAVRSVTWIAPDLETRDRRPVFCTEPFQNELCPTETCNAQMLN